VNVKIKYLVVVVLSIILTNIIMNLLSHLKNVLGFAVFEILGVIILLFWGCLTFFVINLIANWTEKRKSDGK